MSTQNYTLEKHLKSLATEDKDYEVLYSIWELNKQNIAQGLNTIAAAFPHYSRHDISHTMNILNNIQCFLGEERIKQLGATDTFLLLMAGLTHDIGMILMHQIIEEKWEDKHMKEILTNFASSNDKVIADAAKILLSHNESNTSNFENFKWALEIKNAVINITAEIFRGIHAEQSSKYILSNDEFKKIAANFHSEQLPRRFIELLADIALLHGENFDKVISELYFKANGYKRDFIHPRFIVCMIRLGDLLDFDSNRFNPYSIATVGKMPNTSLLHQQKHAAVKHMLISPDSIEVELNCMDEDVYRISKSWFDWLQDEVNNQSLNWIDISPANLEGLPPIIKKNHIKILYQGIDVRPELLNLKFTMSAKKMFEILKGGGIYKEPGFVFIREIVQNAFDATKLQIWNDITERQLPRPKFPDEMPQDLYSQYPIKLTIAWKENKDNNNDIKTLCIECSDRGTGISEETLIRMTKNVGESHKGDLTYKQSYDDMPYWLRPTAAFGIGLQSIFFVTSEFTVETSYPGESKKRIIFRSAAEEQYSHIEETNIQHHRGSTIKIEIPEDRFSEIFGNSFQLNVLGETDISNGDNIYLAKLDHFVYDTFATIDNINFEYQTENTDRCFVRNGIEEIKDEKLIAFDQDINPLYKLFYKYNDNILFFKIYEKEVGTSLYFRFRDTLDDYYPAEHQLLLRDIPVANMTDHHSQTSYLHYVWNLNNQESDKIVDLSRDNLTYAGKKWFTDKFIDQLLPTVLKLINSIFTQELQNELLTSSLLKIQYFNYCLMKSMYNDLKPDIFYLKDLKLPSTMISHCGEEVSAEALMQAQELLWVNGFKYTGRHKILENEKHKIEELYKDDLANAIVIWGDYYLSKALSFNYECTEIVKYDEICEIYKLIKREKSIITREIRQKYKSVKCLHDRYLIRLRNSSFPAARETIYGLDKYSSLRVNCYWGFERFPMYSSCGIYSPFKDTRQVQSLEKDIEGMEKEDIMDYIKSNFSKYVSPYMLQVVKDNNIDKNITKEQIKEGYISLINDFIEVNKKYPPQEKKS